MSAAPRGRRSHREGGFWKALPPAGLALAGLLVWEELVGLGRHDEVILV